MNTIQQPNLSFAQMTASVPPEIRKEIDLEFAVSNRIDALMKKYGYTKIAVSPKNRQTSVRNHQMAQRSA